MNRYPPPIFRPAFGIAAAAMSAITLSVLVVLPVSLATACDNPLTIASAPAAVEVSLAPIVVVARRDSNAS